MPETSTHGCAMSLLPAPQATVLGFDVGQRRTGVALGNVLSGARALAVINMYAHGADWVALDRLFQQWLPQGLIVGDPLTLDGQDQPIRQQAHAFAHQLQQRYHLPVALVDERSSSMEAARWFAAERGAGRKRRRDAAQLDATAAAIIVQRWLNAPLHATPLTPLPVTEPSTSD